MSYNKLIRSINESLSTQRNTRKPACSDCNHIIDFQMEILDALYPNVEIVYGPKKNLFDHNNDLQEIKNDISYIWHKYEPLIKNIRFWAYMKLISLCFTLLLIGGNIVAYFMFIKHNIDTQNDNSCSLFTLIYQLCLLTIIGWPLMHLRMRNYYNSLTRKWRSNFINNMVLLINNKLSTKYSSKQWTFETIYPIRVQQPKQHPTNWCYLRIKSNINDETQHPPIDHKQPIYATSEIYDGETHLVMDFDVYLKDDILGINIINGKKKQEYPHQNAVQEIGEFLMNLRVKYEKCLLTILWVLLFIICLVMLSIPWSVCTGYITGKATVDNKNFNIEIYIIIGVSIVAAISFVIVSFCCKKWLFKYRKWIFMKQLKTFMNNVLSKTYPNYAYSIIYSKKEENMWCQLRISDHVLKCRVDDKVYYTTYNDTTSISIRNQSFGSSPMKSPLF